MNHKSAVTFEFLTFPRVTDLYSWLYLILKQGVAMHLHMPSLIIFLPLMYSVKTSYFC